MQRMYEDLSLLQWRLFRVRIGRQDQAGRDKERRRDFLTIISLLLLSSIGCSQKVLLPGRRPTTNLFGLRISRYNLSYTATEKHRLSFVSLLLCAQ